MWCNSPCRTRACQSTPLLAQSSRPLTRNLVGYVSHAAAIVMTARRCLAHRRDRASARRLGWRARLGRM
eukprot:1865105-Pyramimonas_sp.AAC.1